MRAGFVVPSAIRGDRHVVPAELPECEAAVALHVGPYDRLRFAYQAIRSWIAERGHEDEMRTQVVWPVRPRASVRTAA